MSVIFTGGGTLGSITGLLTVLKEIKKTSIPCYWIAPEGSQGKDQVEALGVTWAEVPAGKIPRHLSLGLLTGLPNMVKGYKASKTLLSSFEARVVVSSGSFVSPPIFKASKKLGLKNVLVQLDIRMGLANKVSIPLSDKIFFSYPNTNPNIKDQVVVGPFIRRHQVDESMVEIPDSLSKDLPTVLFTGGGTGSSDINKLVWEALPRLTKIANVIHATGKGKSDMNIGHNNYHQVEYMDTDTMYYWINRAATLVGRAGMGFFSDCIGYKKAAIAIPIPRSHQVENVQYFKKADAIITPDNPGSVDATWLVGAIKELLNNEKRRASLEKNIGAFEKEGTARKVAHAIEVLHEQ